MAALPFGLRRPWMLLRGALIDRDRPNVRHLRSIDDPERFVWAILPHAARTFAASIVLLPRAQARAAAVAYLYCRILDSYEDLHVDDQARQNALRSFATRLTTEPLDGPPRLPEPLAKDQREYVHVLLVQRCELVDRVFLTLPPRDRANIAALVASMAEGMLWSSAIIRDQGGVLETEAQLNRYCHNVIGEPALFAIRLLVPGPITDSQQRDALTISEMIQLANITRDIERDLHRGVGYHPSLKPFLRPGAKADIDTAEHVRTVREELLVSALQRAPAYGRLVEELDLPRFSAARASAVLMLLFTDRHYRSCAALVGHPSWNGPRRTTALVLTAMPAAISPRWASRILRRIERNFLEGAKGELSTGPGT